MTRTDRSNRMQHAWQTALVAILVCMIVPTHAFLSRNHAVRRRVQSSPLLAESMDATEATLSNAKQQHLQIALTREDGKNTKLRKELETAFADDDLISLIEIPCIEHGVGPDLEALASTLQSQSWDYVAITSPEAAKVFAPAWQCLPADAHRPRVAVVGKATQQQVLDLGIPVDFCPSKATAKTLAAELDVAPDATTLLYPASAKAKPTLQKDLQQRGVAVTRLDTYDTVAASWSQLHKEQSDAVQIACFGSPSAVEGWLRNTQDANERVMAACIGETSANACREYGWAEDRIFYPQANPGIAGWVTAIQQAAASVRQEEEEEV